ncbi:hypothetical protein acdb102_43740 [Acidothermaceae bacterium B102]|nr:hypothetical protein acdb102_43740 [Acidothermaceae bacterium B102]
MRVGVNTAILRRGHSGTASVTRLIVDVLTSQGHDVVELDPPWQRGESRVRNLVRSVSWDLWGAARAEPIDLLISPCNVGLAPRPLPHLLYMQDTMPLDHPELFDRGFNLYVRLLFGFSVRRASLVVTASEHAAGRIRARWPAVGGALRVAPWPTRSVVDDEPRSTRPAGRRVVVVLGATEPHKRTAMAVEVVHRLRQRTGEDVALQVIGPDGRAEPEVAAAIAAADPAGQWVSRFSEPTDDGVRERLRGAWVLLQCSSDEGFCLPLLEASTVGLPAVHTGTGSMAEVHPYGNAGDSPTGLVDALLRLTDDAAYATASYEGLEVARRHNAAAFGDRLAGLVEETVRTASGRG